MTATVTALHPSKMRWVSAEARAEAVRHLSRLPWSVYSDLLRDDQSELWRIVFEMRDTVLLDEVSRARHGLDGPSKEQVEQWLRRLVCWGQQNESEI